MKSFLKSYFWVPALISALIYCQVLWFGSAWGDDHVVVDPIAKDFKLMLKGFYQNFPGSHFFPFSFFQCFLINMFFGENAFPFGFHFYQLVLHIISCLLAVMVFYKLTNNKLISIVIVSLWTVHPLNVESLTRLVCAPAHIPSATFCLAFFHFFLCSRQAGASIGQPLSPASTFFFLISITSYEQYILFPLVVGLTFFLLQKRGTFLVFPVVLVYVVYIFFRYFACGQDFFYSGNEFLSWTDIGSAKDILFRTFWLAPQLLVHYLRLFFWPDFLAESKADWYTVGSSVWSFYSIFCQLLILFLILSSVFLRKKIPLFSIGIFWFFICMLPVIQIIPLYTIVDEHYCYLGILGIFLSVFSLLNYCFKNLSPRFLVILLVPIFCLLAWRTLLYIPSSKDYLTQWIYMYKEAPERLKANAMAKIVEYAGSNNIKDKLPKWACDKALEEEFDKWILKNQNVRVDLSYKFGPMQMPDNYYFYKGILKYLYYKKRYKEIDLYIQQALSVKNNWFGFSEIAKFLQYSQDPQGAWRYISKAIELNPNLKLLYDINFIQIAKHADKFSEAEKIIKDYIQKNPKSSYPYLFAGLFYSVFYKDDIALMYFKEGISENKTVSINYKELYYCASELFTQYKMTPEAKKALKIIVSFDPFDVSAREASKL